MYHLLVTAEEGAWDRPFYEFDRSRFLEYTNEQTAKAFEVLTAKHIETLLTWPCLFAYEGTTKRCRVGHLRSVKERGRTMLIEFEFEPRIRPIPFPSINRIAPLLDIRKWEMNRTHWAIKDEDLFQRLRDAAIIKDIGEQAPAAQVPDVAAPDAKVSSVGDFIDAVLQMQSDGKEVFYRGHSNAAKYKLEPRLFRKDEQGNYLFLDSEHTLYRELLVSNSIDFRDDHYTIDRLVRMQHYSLPTRLLDITSNPLIALYFACNSNHGTLTNGQYVGEQAGEVIVFTLSKDRIKYFDSDTASCIANLVKLLKTEKDKVDYGIKGISAFNKQITIKRLFHFIKEEKSFFEPRIRSEDLRSVICVKGKRSNNRISSQSGAFLLFGFEAVLNENGTEEIGVKRIGVTNKAEILRQLDLLNINESTVFPDIESSAKYVANKYSFKN